MLISININQWWRCSAVATYVTKGKSQSSSGLSFGNVLMFLFWEAMMWNHLRGSWDTRVPCISLSLDCWPALIPPAPWRKQTVKENYLPQCPVRSLTSFPPSVLTHVPRNGAVTVCPQGLSSLGPKASWAKINYPDLAFFNPWDTDPDMILSREKKGQISISSSSGYLWHTFKWLNVYLIQTPNPFSLVTFGSNVPGPLFQTLGLLFSVTKTRGSAYAGERSHRDKSRNERHCWCQPTVKCTFGWCVYSWHACVTCWH